jgi:mRNA-degrading endonuclease toxin of MazEF toxin-antitoxin module
VSIAVRGEVWEYTDASGRYRVAVVSSDAHNGRDDAWPLCVLVTHRTPPGGAIPAYAVALADPDPLGGVVITPTMRGLPPDGFGSRLGMLTGQTVNRVESALRDLLELP